MINTIQDNLSFLIGQKIKLPKSIIQAKRKIGAIPKAVSFEITGIYLICNVGRPYYKIYLQGIVNSKVDGHWFRQEFGFDMRALLEMEKPETVPFYKFKKLLNACKKLIRQVEMSDFKDENGMALKMNEFYDRLKKITEGYSNEN